MRKIESCRSTIYSKNLEQNNKVDESTQTDSCPIQLVHIEEAAQIDVHSKAKRVLESVDQHQQK